MIQKRGVNEDWVSVVVQGDLPYTDIADAKVSASAFAVRLADSSVEVRIVDSDGNFVWGVPSPPKIHHR